MMLIVVITRDWYCRRITSEEKVGFVHMQICMYNICIKLTADTLPEEPLPMLSVCYLVCKQSLDDSESEREYGAHRVGRLHLQSAARLHSNQTDRVWSERPESGCKTVSAGVSGSDTLLGVQFGHNSSIQSLLGNSRHLP